MRKVETETTIVKTGAVAASSHEAPFFNLISPHTIRRLAIRKTVGAKKYGSVQWRQGINDAQYVADRWNHFMEHVLEFMESGNEDDDNIGGMLWALDCISEVERLAPDAFKYVVGISSIFGERATEFHNKEMNARKEKASEPVIEEKHSLEFLELPF
jgi:hypothetical protein